MELIHLRSSQALKSALNQNIATSKTNCTFASPFSCFIYCYLSFLIHCNLVLVASCWNKCIAIPPLHHKFRTIVAVTPTYSIEIPDNLLTNTICTALVYGIFVTPTIATSFAAPKIAELLYVRIDWRWAFGASALTLLVACLPLTFVLSRASQGAEVVGRASRVIQNNVERHWPQTLRSFLVELDIPGITLSTTGLCLVLLPFTLAPTAESGWKSAAINIMLVFGFVSIIGFIVWEKRFAAANLMPWTLMRNRNILGGCLVGFASVGSVGIWDAYYGSYLQVVHDQSITTAGYISNTYPLAFAISAPLFGM